MQQVSAVTVDRIEERARRIHQDLIVIDSTCPLVQDDDKHLDLYRAGGFTAIALTVLGKRGTSADALLSLGKWNRLCREHDDLLLVRRDVFRALKRNACCDVSDEVSYEVARNRVRHLRGGFRRIHAVLRDLADQDPKLADGRRLVCRRVRSVWWDLRLRDS